MDVTPIPVGSDGTQCSDNGDEPVVNMDTTDSNTTRPMPPPTQPVTVAMAKNIASVQPLNTCPPPRLEEEQIQMPPLEECRPSTTDSLSLLRDTLPGFKSTPSQSPDDGIIHHSEDRMAAMEEDHFEASTKRPTEQPDQLISDRDTMAPRTPPTSLNLMNRPRGVVMEDEYNDSDSSEIDEDALSIIIAVEGEDDDDIGDNIKMEDEDIDPKDQQQVTTACSPSIPDPSTITNKDKNSNEPVIDLTIGSSEQAQTKPGNFSDFTSDDGDVDKATAETTEVREKTVQATVGSSAQSDNSATKKGDKSDSSEKSSSKQSAKVKQFFTTLQMFGNKISQEVAEQVQELIAALVNDLVTVEEFHTEIQKVTNHPLKDFVVPFLKENLSYFCRELKSTSVALSDILGTAPKSTAPAVAPEISEPELVVVHSTKPSAPVQTSTVVTTTPISPLRAPANLTSMSVPPATIHEPNLVSPTKIESVVNASVAAGNNHRKRPRELVMGNGSDDRDSTMATVMRSSKRPRPIPTATLTPEPPLPPSNPISTISSPIHHATPIIPHTHHTPSSTHTHVATPLSTTHHMTHSRNQSTSAVATPTGEIPTGVAALAVSSNQRIAFINQVKEDWNHLETMLVSVEGMVVKTQKALSSLKERIQQIGLGPSPSQLKAYEVEIEQRYQLKLEKSMEEVQQQANEERQRVLLDAAKQVRESIREINTQSNSKECCWNCGRKATETCSGCNKARYCGTFCQHKDWDRHMSQCTRSRSSGTTVRVEKEGPQVQIAAGSHNHAPIKNPAHYIPGPHPSHSSTTYIRSNTSRTPTPTSYTPTGSEMYVPVLTDPSGLANGGTNTLTATSGGVAVVTINRNPAESGINIV